MDKDLKRTLENSKKNVFRMRNEMRNIINYIFNNLKDLNYVVKKTMKRSTQNFRKAVQITQGSYETN
jgi:hypothetical protein